MISRLRSFATRLYGRLSRREPYRPGFEDGTFFSCLARSTRGREAPNVQEALRALDEGDVRAARAHAARHFRTRSTPRFFVDIQLLKKLARQIEADLPAWKSITLERVRNDFEHGLTVYGIKVPPLGEGFPWGDLPRGPGDDVLYAVRPHRFGFAPRAALAALYGAPTAGSLHKIIGDWMTFAATTRQALPYLSNLVVIQRFLALSWAWAFLAGRPEDELNNDYSDEIAILKVLQEDARFLATRLGDSVANNHLLADLFAGWYIHVLFPEFVSGPTSRAEYEGLWLAELRRQTYEDGSSFEHSTHYHELACEMAAAYVLLSRRNGYETPEWVLERIERMLSLQADIGGPEALPLAIGNSTEDPFFPLDAQEGWGTAALREICRALFRPDLAPAPADDSTVERAFWLLGGKFAPPEAGQTRGRGCQAYPVGGFFVLPESDPSTRLVFRTGPAPDRPLFPGHMHADLLSVYLTVAGNPTIVESGTYSYRLGPDGWTGDAPAWRAYLAGPRAHNGLAAAGEDPLGPLKGDFRSQEARARVETTRWLAHPVGVWVEGKITGDNPYAGYCRGVVHVCDEYWLLYDLLPPAIPFEGSTFGFQFCPGAQVVPEPPAVRAKIRNVNLCIIGSNGLAGPTVVCGQTDPPGGWVSSRYGELTPAPQVVFGIDGSSRLTAFLLQPRHSEGNVSEIESRGDLESGLAFRIVSRNVVDHVFLRSASARKPLEAWGVRFDGALLWLRTSDEKPVALRCLDSRSVSSRRFGIEVNSKDAEQFEINSTPTGIGVNHCPQNLLSITWPGDKE